MADAYMVTFLGTETACYGELLETSNFQVVCANEDDDGLWATGVDSFTEHNYTWETVVLFLQMHFESDILEITAV